MKNNTELKVVIPKKTLEKWNQKRIKYKFWGFYKYLSENSGVEYLKVTKAFNKGYATPENLQKIEAQIQKMP